MSNLGQRGGAGVVSRHTSGTTVGPARAPELVNLLSFAVRRARVHKTQAKRAAAVAEYLDNVSGAVVIAERAVGDVLRLTVAIWPPLRASNAEQMAEGCPEYVAGSFEVVR
jgi:hypothetical protein